MPPSPATPTVESALRQAAELLEDARIPVARLTAEVLLAHTLSRDRAWLYAHPEHELSELAWLHYGRHLHERLLGKPTQYITGRQEFYGREFRVGPEVLIPRPETEHVVEAALGLIEPGWTIADAGTGSGAIAVSLALERRCRVFATDISHDAVRAAAANSARLGANVGFFRCDLVAALRSRSLDMVVSNPPYVPSEDQEMLQPEVRDWEPHVALFGGSGGLDLYRRLIEDAARVLKPGGWLVMELGYRSLKPVMAMLGSRWSGGEAVADLAGIPRVLVARLA